MTRVAAPEGQRINLTLQDGTNVWLNSGAEIEYPSLFAGNSRQVRLSGEALFDVSRDTRRPFVVETFACKVEVLGTRFNVNADERHDVFSTALMRGSVRVSSLADPQQQVVLQTPRKSAVERRATVAPYVGRSQRISLGRGPYFGERPQFCRYTPPVRTLLRRAFRCEARPYARYRSDG